MSLHPLIPDYKLPACLKRPLVFGDREQIDALDRLEGELQKKVQLDQKIKDGILKHYAVNVSFEAETTIYVYAENPAEAKHLALEEADIDSCDIDVDAGWAQEIIGNK